MKNLTNPDVDLFVTAVSRLETAGQMAIAFRKKQVSLGAFEREFIGKAREQATRAGISRPMQAEIESRGIIEAVRSFKNIVALILVAASLALSACSHKNQMTGGGSDKDYCAENPSNCAMHANGVRS